MKFLMYKNESELGNVGYTRLIVNPDTRVKTLNMDMTLYKIKSVSGDTGIVTDYSAPHQGYLYFISETTTIKNGVSSTVEEYNGIPITFKSAYDLIGTYWWNGQPVKYRYTEKLAKKS